MAINYSSVVPLMTANNTPSTHIASSSTFLSGSEPYRAFDGADFYFAFSANTLTGWIKIKLDKGRIVSKYTLQSKNGSGYNTQSPKSWSLEGSNDDVSYTTLDTQLNISSWTQNESKSFSISNTNSYQYYRISITSNNGDTGYTVIKELGLFEVQYSNKFLISSGDGINVSISGGGYTDNIIPVMTADDTAKADTNATIYNNNHTSYGAWKAFDGLGSGTIWSTSNAFWLRYKFAEPKKIGKYSILTHVDPIPTAWTFEGSNDGNSWTVLDTRSGNVKGANSTDFKTFTISNPQKFSQYRINVTSTNGSGALLPELQMFEVIEPYLKALPSQSEGFFLSHGMDKSISIDLSKPITKVVNVRTDSTAVGSGKVFRHIIDTSKIPIKKATIT
ncbi:discoidin domain-containing protein [Paenibacillus tianjinensis]|uniref:Discoidin domain-containing protein n=1 Tax=Paenibacillus tianjinensis TaxID=2810347 RepID=A0ABX7L6Z4_9BACL|nr:discoidin domain-containing protein [Paenibacillus tianjinensis]QSF43566.1 discoidin domain-containing protein [Paenibacillus tianjinensis]